MIVEHFTAGRDVGFARVAPLTVVPFLPACLSARVRPAGWLLFVGQTKKSNRVVARYLLSVVPPFELNGNPIP